MREALQSGLQTYDLRVEPKNLVHRPAGAVAVAVACGRPLVASSAVAADDFGFVDYIETTPPRSRSCQLEG